MISNGITISTEVNVTKLPEHLDSHTAIYVFGLLMVGIIIMSVLKMVLYSTVCKKSNRSIHNMMATNLVRAPTQFFEANDSGKFWNIFGIFDQQKFNINLQLQDKF